MISARGMRIAGARVCVLAVLCDVLVARDLLCRPRGTESAVVSRCQITSMG
jgi:hypothetical protein